jgi:hypothetical protein
MHSALGEPVNQAAADSRYPSGDRTTFPHAVRARRCLGFRPGDEIAHRNSDRSPGAAVVTQPPKRHARRVNGLAAVLATLVVVAAIIVVISTSGGPGHKGKTGSAPSPGTCRSVSNSESPFACSSIWNAPLSANAPLSPQSSQYASLLQGYVKEYGGWIDTYSYSVPVYTVSRDQPNVPVALDTSGSGSADELARVFKAGVPIPPGAKAAAGSDQHMVVWQPSTDTMWEFWHAHQVSDAWHASWGGKMTNVSSNPGYFSHPSDWGATATSLPLLGGLIGTRELESGRIDHALALAIPHAANGVVAAPAQRSDGNLRSHAAIPEGTRFRLSPHFDLSTLHAPTIVRVLAQAVQRYGMIVRDQSGAVSLYAQDPTPTGHNPYYGAHGLFDGLSPAVVMRYFPWKALQVVRPAKLSG